MKLTVRETPRLPAEVDAVEMHVTAHDAQGKPVALSAELERELVEASKSLFALPTERIEGVVETRLNGLSQRIEKLKRRMESVEGVAADANQRASVIADELQRVPPAALGRQIDTLRSDTEKRTGYLTDRLLRLEQHDVPPLPESESMRRFEAVVQAGEGGRHAQYTYSFEVDGGYPEALGSVLHDMQDWMHADWSIQGIELTELLSWEPLA